MMDFTQKKFKLSKTTINYVCVGSGPVLVFIHGLTNDWLTWTPLAEALKKSYKLYLIDLPGYGSSGTLPRYTISIQARCVHEFVKKLKIKPESFVGTSMGASVVAKLNELYPQSAKTFILISAYFKTGWKKWLIRLYQTFLKTIRGYKLITMLLKMVITSKVWVYCACALVNMEKFDRRLVDSFNLSGKKKMTKEAFVDMSISTNNMDLADTLRRCRKRTLLIQGTGDKIANYESVKHILFREPKVSVIPVTGGGHLVFLERPSEVAGIIKKYLT